MYPAKGDRWQAGNPRGLGGCYSQGNPFQGKQPTEDYSTDQKVWTEDEVKGIYKRLYTPPTGHFRRLKNVIRTSGSAGDVVKIQPKPDPLRTMGELKRVLSLLCPRTEPKTADNLHI